MNEATYKVTEIIFMFLVPSAGRRLRRAVWMKHFHFLIWFQYLPNIGNDDVNITLVGSHPIPLYYNTHIILD